jgi:release factor glutamine methyltransferase
MGRLREARVPSHTLAAELLLMHVLGRDRAWLYAHPEQPLEPGQLASYLDLVERRAAGVPTQYLTGKQEFWGLEFEVTPDVLIPRPETEHLVEVALERLGPPKWEAELSGMPRGHGLRIADVGTGSGCLAIALAHELPGAQVFATDISAAALAVARRNALRHGVAGRVHFVQSNLLDAFDRSDEPFSAFAFPAGLASGADFSCPTTARGPVAFDLIVSNPPYIGRSEASLLPREVREHEPAQALFAGDAGPEFYMPLVTQALRLLRPGGILVLELGYNALPHVRPLFDAWNAWRRIRLTHDLAGIPRVLSAERA